MLRVFVCVHDLTQWMRGEGYRQSITASNMDSGNGKLDGKEGGCPWKNEVLFCLFVFICLSVYRSDCLSVCLCIFLFVWTSLWQYVIMLRAPIGQQTFFLKQQTLAAGQILLHFYSAQSWLSLEILLIQHNSPFSSCIKRKNKKKIRPSWWLTEFPMVLHSMSTWSICLETMAAIKTTLCFSCFVYITQSLLSTSVSLYPIDCAAELRSLFLAYLKAIRATCLNYRKVHDCFRIFSWFYIERHLNSSLIIFRISKQLLWNH